MNDKQNRLFKYGMTGLGISLVLLIMISLYSVLKIAVIQSIQLVSEGSLDLSIFALIIVSTLLTGSTYLIFRQWSLAHSYLYVSDSHMAVSIADRRDEFFANEP